MTSSTTSRTTLTRPRTWRTSSRVSRSRTRDRRRGAPMHSDVILVLVIGTALAFDFTNGFHDTANVVATAISTRAVPPRMAIAIASLLNFVGAFISLKVAATVAKGIIDPKVVEHAP